PTALLSYAFGFIPTLLAMLPAFASTRAPRTPGRISAIFGAAAAPFWLAQPSRRRPLRAGSRSISRVPWPLPTTLHTWPLTTLPSGTTRATQGTLQRPGSIMHHCTHTPTPVQLQKHHMLTAARVNLPQAPTTLPTTGWTSCFPGLLAVGAAELL